MATPAVILSLKDSPFAGLVKEMVAGVHVVELTLVVVPAKVPSTVDEIRPDTSRLKVDSVPLCSIIEKVVVLAGYGLGAVSWT